MNQQTNHKPTITAFVCNWCSYAGADAAGTSRLQYDDSVRIVRFPCTGRIDPLFIVKAFEQGADGVLVSGCHPGDCHYVSGNLYARRRFNIFRKLMMFLGLDERRLQFSWVSAAEGAKWAQVVNAVSEGVKQVAGEAFEWAKPRSNGKRENARPQKHAGEFSIESEQFEKITAQLRARARELLQNKQVNAVLGYAQGTLPKTTIPFFATKPELAEQLIWNAQCRNNLAVYLTAKLVRKLGKIALVTKACDARAIIGLLQEHQIKREDLYIVGVACRGIVDDGSTQVALKCFTCDRKAPMLYDELIGDAVGATGVQTDVLEAEIKQLEALDAADRWNYWQEQFARCIRCYACRAVCPLCYCETCITDKHRPQWIPTSAHAQGNFAWNIVRAMHLAGRCIGCNECARVCPAHIRLDLINKKIALDIQQEFGYRAGETADTAPPLATFRPDDRQEFIR